MVTQQAIEGSTDQNSTHCLSLLSVAGSRTPRTESPSKRAASGCLFRQNELFMNRRVKNFPVVKDD